MANPDFGPPYREGTFGWVYKMVAGPDGELVALKQLKDGVGEDDRKRFLREVRMQALLRHKHVVPILSQNLDAESPYFSMPFAQSNLRDYLQDHSGEGSLWVFRQLAEGVAHAHEEGVIHRDLKPDNVLLFEDDAGQLFAAVGDFGLGRLQTRDSTTITMAHVGLGTIAYMAPEQWTNAKDADEQCDIYALGKMLAEVITGEIPYPDINYRKIPSGLAYVIRKACENDPDKRHGSVREMLADIDIATDYLVTTEDPTEEIKKILQTLMGGAYSTDDIRKLSRLFAENTRNTKVLTELFPQVPEDALALLFSQDSNQTKALVRIYDAAISGGLPFQYCDIVANFYEKMFRAIEDYDVRTMILHRLPRIAYNHTRWHVARVYANILAKLSDRALILFVRSDLREDRAIGEWLATYVRHKDIAPEIREVIAE